MIVKQYHKIFSALSLMTISLWVGITLTEPTKVHGQRKGKISLLQERKRDPFRLPEGVRSLSKIDASPQGPKAKILVSEAKPTDISPPLKVKAILITDHIRLASIDRYIVKVGDLLNDERVLEIRPDQVILGKEGKKRSIFLDQSPIQLIVEER